MLLLVRNHPQYFAQIAVAYQRSLAQFAFTFLVFRRQDVAQVRMSPLHFSCRGLLKALGRALVGFQFRHVPSISPSESRLPARKLPAVRSGVRVQLLWNLCYGVFLEP